MSAPQYIPEYAGSSRGTEILTPEQANISGEGTSDTTLRRDFAGLASYLCAITGGCKSDSSTVTNDGTYNFGKKFFFNTNNKCSLIGDENTYCNPTSKAGDSVYEYIYVNTTSNGLLPGVLTNVENLAKIPGKMVSVMSGIGGTKCKCVTLKVTGDDGTEKCAGAFINSSNVNDSDIVKNACNSNIITPTYTSDSPVSTSSLTSGLASGLSSVGFGKSGFTTMYLNQVNTIDTLFFVIINLLALFILYRIII
jgi:hypothetical protein